MRLTCLGGAGEIGANSYFLEAGGSGVLLDAGLHPKKEGPPAMPRLDAAGELDHIVITHAHLDHVGALPAVLRRNPRARVHMSAATHRFAARMLRNSVNVMARRHERDPAATPLFGFSDVEMVDEVVEEHDFEAPFSVGRGVTVELVPAGHVPGAAGVLVRDAGSGAGAKSLFYTGDTCGSTQLLVPAASAPRSPVDVLLTESTYGSNPLADSTRLADVVHAFGVACARVVARGGVVLAPVFALGRAQELLFALWKLGQKGRLPPVPVYLSGLATAVVRLYDQTRRLTPRCDPEVRLDQLGFRVLEREELDAGGPEGPAIVLASSGMLLPETASSALARRVLREPGDALFVVGYQDPDSPGYRVQHAALGDRIDLGDGGAPVERRCAIERFHFRSHASRAELLAAARAMKPRRAVVVHGDPASSDSLAASLREGGADVLLPQPAVPIDL